MSNRKSTMFFGLLLIVVASLVAGMVIAARLDLSPASEAQTFAAPPMNSAPISGPVTATTFRDIAKAVSPAVVNIRTESTQRTQDLNDLFQGGGGGGGSDLFDRFFGLPQNPRAPQGPQQRPRQAPRERVLESAGTGFIIDKAGLILTNNHVVEGANKIVVSLYNDEDQEYEARIVGRDPLTDSALIELTEKPNHALPEIRFGDSGQMQPGDWVMAIGNPFGYEHTVTVGVVSGVGRPFQSVRQRNTPVIQTDAAINPGNSGGPLLNLRGEVIGMNTAIYTDGRQANIGIGFAVPINTVRELLPQLRGGKITRGVIGIEVQPVGRDEVSAFGLKSRDGAVVRRLTDRSGPAAKAGIEPGDVIVSFNGKPVQDSDDLPQMVTATRPGTTVPLRIVRNGKEQTLNLTVGELNLDAEQQPQQRTGAGGPAAETPTGFGLYLDNVTPELARRFRLEETRGALVADVEEGSPAHRAGLAPGDIIKRVKGVAVATAAEAQRELGKVASGDAAFLVVSRQGEGDIFISVRKE
jgi:serine protease Do